MKKLILTSLSSLALGILCQAQVNSNYEIAKWQGFKTAALSYTWDDLTSKQLSDALPIYDKYQFNMTFNVVINWSPNWASLNTAAKNGHEVASHTVSHGKLSTLSIADQETQLSSSQSTINSNITTVKCVTTAYPECVIGDKTTISKYYIAGRTCDGKINPASPSDFYTLGAYICGNTGINTAAGLNTIADNAVSAKGWGVYLFHGINNDGGYSPIEGSVLDAHLGNINTNNSKYWVGTFGDVARYIKERDAASLNETTVTADSLQIALTDNLDNTIFTTALSIRRAIPSGWAGAKVFLGNKLISSTISTINNIEYINFDVAPDKGNIYIVNAAPKTAIIIELVAGWNFIGCPLTGSTPVETALADIWDNVVSVKNQDAFYIKDASPSLNLLTSLDWSHGYMLNISQPCKKTW